MAKPIRLYVDVELTNGETADRLATWLKRALDAHLGRGVDVTVTWTRPPEPVAIDQLQRRADEIYAADRAQDAVAEEMSDEDFRQTFDAFVTEAARRGYDADHVRFKMTRTPAREPEPGTVASLGDERQYREELRTGRDPRD